MVVKYTDIDYLVFSDAAKYVSLGRSPYDRDTYRYTPLLAWMLVPNSWGGIWYSFGKVVFIASDLITGYIIAKLLSRDKRLSSKQVVYYSSLWLLNPMVITISTRGSSESVLTVLIMLAFYFLLSSRLTLSAVFLGLSIHFKIYPVIYLPSVVCYLANRSRPISSLPILRLVNKVTFQYVLITAITLTAANALMYYIYGYEFLEHSYLYHLTRIDHRHNFSVYNVILYYKSALETGGSPIEKFAFLPQLVISAVLIPLKLAHRDVVSAAFLSTFAFVMLNKVITSQYFIWFLIFLPHFLTKTHLSYGKGALMVGVWVATQGSWLYYAYNLEFLGQSTFDNGLLWASIGFFLGNSWILGEMINDQLN